MQKSSVNFLLSGVLVLAACSFGNTTNDSNAQPATETELTSNPQSMTLGGGLATEIHPGDGGSPHVKVDWVINGANISITYGRPYLKGRVVFNNVEPMDTRVWRLGADEATTLLTDRDMMFGDAHVPAGEYTLWTISYGDLQMDGRFYLIINSQIGQWGTDYDQTYDLARVVINIEELDPPAEQLTLTMNNEHFGFDWGSIRTSVPIMVH